MNRSDENNHALVRPKNAQGNTRMGGTRRALSVINPNAVATRASGALKRGLQETKVENGAGNPIIPINRPITRRFAAQLALKQQESASFKILTSEEAKKTKPPTKKPIDLNSASIDVEEYQIEKDSSIAKKSNQMEDDDMDDILLEPITDIDGSDLKDPLKVVEYIEEIYSYHRNAEISFCVPPNYLEKQFDINEKMRAILIDWLIEVHYKFELMDETLFLMVNLIDRFLALQTVERKNLQLVGVTALLLACKYEEVSVPVVGDLITITDKAYTRKELLAMERLIVNKLQFNMCVPTPYVFMIRFLKAAQSDKKLELLSFYLIELCLLEYGMLKFRPSLLAAAAIFTAQCTIDRFKHWTKTCEWHTSYSEDQLLECSKLMVTIHQKAETARLRGVYKKYSGIEFGYATKSEPALFLL